MSIVDPNRPANPAVPDNGQQPAAPESGGAPSAVAGAGGEDGQDPAQGKPAPTYQAAPGQSVRDRMFEDMNARRAEQGLLVTEGEGDAEAGGEPQPAAPAASPASPQPAAPVTPAVVVAPAIPTADGFRKTLKVRGQDREITDPAEFERLAQIGAAADEKFLEAKRLKEEAEHLVAQALRTTAAPQPGQPQAQPEPAAPAQPQLAADVPTEADIVAKRKAYIEKAQLGTAEEAEQAFIDYEAAKDRRSDALRAATAPAPVNVDEIVSRAVSASEHTSSAKQVLAQFQSENEDIVHNPVLMAQTTEFARKARFDNMVAIGFMPQELAEMHVDQFNALYRRAVDGKLVTPIPEVMKQAAEQTRTWIKDTAVRLNGGAPTPTGQPPAAPTPQGAPAPAASGQSPQPAAPARPSALQSRIELKRTNLQQPPTGVATPTPTDAPTQPGRPSTAEAVGLMRQKRGFRTTSSAA